jgi:predicted alpha-1,2-mannosidase
MRVREPFVVVFLGAIVCLSLVAQQKKQPVDYVNPNIGGIGHLLTATLPTVQLPYGMMRIVPATLGGVDRYLARRLAGLPVGGVVAMPTAGPLETRLPQYASEFDRDFETVTPYYGSTVLDTYGITVEYTVAQRAAMLRIAYPSERAAHLLFTAGRGGQIAVAGSDAVAGFSAGNGAHEYFYAISSRPFNSPQPFQAQNADTGRGRGGNGRGGAGEGAGLSVDLVPRSGEPVTLRIATSYISTEQARRNLAADIPEADFEHVKSVARATWNRELGKIAVEGGTEEQRTIFYTALYRSMGRPTDITEQGNLYYSSADDQPHSLEGHHFYTGDNFWDTHRSLHPLQLLLDPTRQVDMIRSLLIMYDGTGWLPTAPTIGGDRGVMIGHHATPFITDVYRKGYRDFDIEKAYAGMRKNATEATMLPWRRGPLTELDQVYLQKGFFPALAKGQTETVKEVHPSERRQAVSVTLENCYDDWNLAQMAKALHKDEDYAYFSKRAHNYENVFDKRIGFMAPKSADGQWVEGFDPKLGGGQGGRDYFTEMNSWTYTFQVQHDIPGLIRLLGGKEAFTAKLDALFTEGYSGSKYVFLAKFPDMTGLIGQYAQGNEPSFHIPYLYNYAGQPWKTQFRLRQIMQVWYTDELLGIPGDDDGGAMSSWYVLSAMGFFPVTVGRPIYDIGSPIFRQVRISLPGGKAFTIVARNVSARNKYVQSAELNGKRLEVPRFAHSDVVKGGTLVLEMGATPNKSWGSQPDPQTEQSSEPTR